MKHNDHGRQTAPTPSGKKAGPTFSVIICIPEESEALERTLTSVLAQTDQQFEIILVDHGSSTTFAATARSLLREQTGRTKHVACGPQLSDSAARNAGLAQAAGKIATFIDCGDVWHPRYLALIRSGYDAVPNALCVFTNYVGNGSAPSGAVEQLDLRHPVSDPISLMLDHPFIHTMSCFSAPVRALLKIGGFNERLRLLADVDLYLRLMLAPYKGEEAWRRRRIVCIPHFAVLRRPPSADQDSADDPSSLATAKQALFRELAAHPGFARFMVPAADGEEAARSTVDSLV